MNKPGLPKKILDKRIPTLIGMALLIIALVSGTLLIGKGGGVFSPRASAETTPKNVKITNVQDTNFTISFLTDIDTVGFVKYGTEPNSLKSQAADDRDQISGSVDSFKTHHITVRGLQQNTTYYYTIGTGSGSIFDDSGQPFKIKTAARNGSPAAAKTIYGSVTNEAGGPANGAIVYVNVNGAGTMSSQVKNSGSWAIPLSNARTLDGSAYAQISDTDTIIINVQGELPSQVASLTTTVAQSQPVPGIQFGENTIIPPEELAEVAEEDLEMGKDIFANPDQTKKENDVGLNIDLEDSEEMQATDEEEMAVEEENMDDEEEGSSLEEMLATEEDEEESETALNMKVDLRIEEDQKVNTSNPIIIGTATPNTVISITVNSDTQIQQNVTTDENGDFYLDIAQLSESLEPGIHTVTYSYTDPTTGELVERTVTFTVDSPVEQLALAEATPTPYSSGNPYPVVTPTPTPTPTPEATIEATDEATPITATAAATPSSATESARTGQPATDEGVPVSGSVGTTMALVFGGLFFIISGLWSFWISTQLEKDGFEI